MNREKEMKNRVNPPLATLINLLTAARDRNTNIDHVQPIRLESFHSFVFLQQRNRTKPDQSSMKANRKKTGPNRVRHSILGVKNKKKLGKKKLGNGG